jgi:hypothetical protein
MSKQLISELRNALTKSFVKDLMTSVDWAYDESSEAVKNHPLLGPPEAEYLRPYYRRCILERRLQQISKKHKITAEVVMNDAKNCAFTQLWAGNLILTLAHAAVSSQIVRSSNFRQRHAGLNSMLDQMDLFEANPEPKETAKTINAIIYHGTDYRVPQKAGFIKIGFPAPCNTKWAFKLDCYDLLDAYRVQKIEDEDEDLIIKWKRKSGEAAS